MRQSQRLHNSRLLRRRSSLTTGSVGASTRETVQAETLTTAVVPTDQKPASDTAPTPGTSAALCFQRLSKSPKSPPSGPAASRANPPTYPRNAHRSGTGPPNASSLYTTSLTINPSLPQTCQSLPRRHGGSALNHIYPIRHHQKV